MKIILQSEILNKLFDKFVRLIIAIGIILIVMLISWVKSLLNGHNIGN